MTFAKRTYWIAGVVGMVLLLPLYFMEGKMGIDHPPPITHPEFYYGFIGVGLAWQFAFLVIAKDPLRYRALMPATMIEKFSYAIATLVLIGTGRMDRMFLGFSFMDLAFGVAFAVSYIRCGKSTDA